MLDRCDTMNVAYVYVSIRVVQKKFGTISVAYFNLCIRLNYPHVSCIRTLEAKTMELLQLCVYIYIYIYIYVNIYICVCPM